MPQDANSFDTNVLHGRLSREAEDLGIVAGYSMWDLWRSVGWVPPYRLLLDPAPRTVTYEQYERLDGRVGDFPVELVGNTLVAINLGQHRSAVGVNAACEAMNCIKKNEMPGRSSGAAGPIRMTNGNVRIPSFCWTAPDGIRDPDYRLNAPPDEPTFTIDVISEGNTQAEMAIKLADYFASGCRLAWLLYLELRTVRVYADADHYHTLTADDTLTGGDVLPVFEVKVSDLFDV